MHTGLRTYWDALQPGERIITVPHWAAIVEKQFTESMFARTGTIMTELPIDALVAEVFRKNAAMSRKAERYIETLLDDTAWGAVMDDGNSVALFGVQILPIAMKDWLASQGYNL